MPYPSIPDQPIAPVANDNYSYSHVTTATTTTVKTGSGHLHSVVINKPGTTDTLTVYDNTTGSGTVIAAIANYGAQLVFLYDVAFTTGLTIVSGGTAGDYTVTYR